MNTQVDKTVCPEVDTKSNISCWKVQFKVNNWSYSYRSRYEKSGQCIYSHPKYYSDQNLFYSPYTTDVQKAFNWALAGITSWLQNLLSKEPPYNIHSADCFTVASTWLHIGWYTLLCGFTILLFVYTLLEGRLAIHIVRKWWFNFC